MRLNYSHLNEQKVQHGFKGWTNTICDIGSATEITLNFLKKWHQDQTTGLKLLNNIYNLNLKFHIITHASLARFVIIVVKIRSNAPLEPSKIFHMHKSFIALLRVVNTFNSTAHILDVKMCSQSILLTLLLSACFKTWFWIRPCIELQKTSGWVINSVVGRTYVKPIPPRKKETINYKF